MSFKPLLSCEVPLDKLKFPMYCSTKLDGIRAVVIGSVVYSRSLKPIRNKYVQHLFGKEEYNGFDGELIVGDVYAKDVFQKTTSGVMSEEGAPDVKFYVFDMFTIEDTYTTRQTALNFHLAELDSNGFDSSNVPILETTLVEDKEKLKLLLEQERVKGGEGLILRSPDGKYKYGRSTPKEQFSVKLKFFKQDEFEVIGFEERMHNSNELTYNELGYADRSSNKDGLVPMNTLGSIILRYGGSEFKCGTGFNDAQRQEIWDNKGKYLGKLASIRYMEVGSKDKPRVSSFQGWRHEDDL